MGKGKKSTDRAVPPRVAESAAQPWWRAWASEGLAWGLGVVIVIRPLRDGLTFRTDNFYYLWAIAFLFALYLARVLLRGQTIRFGPYIALAAAFPLVALALAPATIQGDSTYRTLLLWSGHFALFMMVADGLRTRLAVNIVMGAFLLASFNEAFWSLLHYQYVLPSLRQMINENPAFLMQYFGAEELSPLLRHRLESNRAFGRFLFPNALAAFLVVAIPYAVASVLPAIRDARLAWGGERDTVSPVSETRLHYAALIGLVSWFLAFIVCTVLFPFFLYHWTGEKNWLGRPILCAIFVGVLPLALAAVPYILARLRGPLACGLTIRAAFFPALLVCQLMSLYLTFSRGGVLAVVLAMGAGGLFLFMAWDGRLARFRPAVAVLLVLGFLALATLSAPSWAQPSPAPQAAAAPQPTADSGGLSIEGRDLTGGDIINPASFFLRVTYWKVALEIAKHYWLTGVGLGNFSTAYPMYQYLGAGDVQAAHNDYLQYLAETGIAGLAAFVAFWAFLLINGARRVLTVEDRHEQLLLTAMLAGVLAFLLHALVDFPFVNPSLAFFEYLLAGLFLARLGLQLPQRLNHSLHRVIAGLLMVATAFAIGASARVFVSDYVLGGRELLNVGNVRALSERSEALRFLMTSRAATSAPGPGDPAMRVGAVYTLIPNLNTLQSFGLIRIPVDSSGRSLRAPTKGEAISPDSLFFITDLARAREEAIKAAKLWLEELQDLDSLYPKNSELAIYMVSMNLQLLEGAPDYQTRLGYSLASLAWAEKAIERNRLQSVCWQYYGLALTYRGNIEPPPKNMDYYDKMLDAYKKATELYPIGHIHWYQYSDALQKISALIKDTEPQRAETLLKLSQEARERGQYIEKYRTETGI